MKCLILTLLTILESKSTKQNDAANFLAFFKADTYLKRKLLRHPPEQFKRKLILYIMSKF